MRLNHAVFPEVLEASRENMSPEIDTTVFVEDFPCAYFTDGRIARIEYLIIDDEVTRCFHRYLAQGYRRLGRTLYRNVCPDCTGCIPIRIPIETFLLTKSQRRTIRTNKDLTLLVHPPMELTPERLALFRNYLLTKHPDPDRTPLQDEEFQLRIIHYGYAYSLEMDYFLDDRLAGVGIVDVGADAISSNYFYYDTALLRRRPGIYSILQEIQLAQALGKAYYYLGFLIRDNRKMSYKADFLPHELLIDGVWQASG